MDNIERLEKKLKEIKQAIEDFKPDFTSKEFIKAFEDDLDRLWEKQHGSGLIRIANSCFYPSDVIKNLDPLGFKVSCKDFARELEKDQYADLFSSYKKLINIKNEIENDLENAIIER